MLYGIQLRALNVHRDHRGSFTEVYSDLWSLPIAPRQFAWVQSLPGALRGMHLHLRHDEYILPMHGRCIVGLYDLRPESPTFEQSQVLDLDGGVPTCLAFPAGILHGWFFPDGGVHLQGVSEPYAEYSGDDNYGCHYADPGLGIDWRGEPSLVSDRARRFPALSVLRERLYRTLANV